MAVELEAIGRDTQAGGERFQVTLVAENGAGDANGQPPTKTTTIALETGNVVHLPAGTDLSHPLQVGNDLEFVQPDGSIVLIPNGAVAGLTVYVGNVEIPPDTVTALFAANHIQPAEGPNGQAQGGHEFNDPGPGGIGNAFGLTPLLGPTDLSFGSTGTQPRYPVEPLLGTGPNHAPEITIIPSGPLDRGGNNLADEAGLPTGSDPTATSEITSGKLHLSDPDGTGDLKTLTVSFGGSTTILTIADITGGSSKIVDLTASGAHGTLTIGGYDPATGDATYTYTLTLPVHDATPNNGADIVSPGDTFSLTVTDVSGVTGTASLVVDVKDDVPRAGVTLSSGTSVSIDESGSGEDDQSGSVPSLFAGLGTPLAWAQSSAAVITDTSAYGADGAGTVIYALSDGSGNGFTGTDSGFKATQTGAEVFLYTEGNLVVGREGVPDGHGGWTASSTGAVAFAIGLDGNNVDVAQYEALIQDQASTTPDDHKDLSSLVYVTQTVTDGDGDVATTTSTSGLTVSFYDDGPLLCGVQSQQVSSDPSEATATGGINFNAGVDGVGATVNITVDTTGLTSGGYGLVTYQNGSILTAYADKDGSHSVTSGDTPVFTLTVDPTTDSYVFDLIAKLDGQVSDFSIATNGAFGSGPASSIVVTNGGSPALNVVMVTGWGAALDAHGKVDGAMTSGAEAAWLAGGSPTLQQDSNVQGSAQGWGLDSGNMTTGAFLRFDFGTPDDYDGTGGYSPPSGITLANVAYATFNFDAIGSKDNIEFVAHYVDGTFGTFIPATGSTSQTISSPNGTLIAWIDAYQSSGSTKLNLTDVGTISTTVDHTIPFTLQLSDGDGDLTSAAGFTVHVKDGLGPIATATPIDPIVLELDHSGYSFTSIENGVQFDINADGAKDHVAWTTPNEGLLAIDLNHDGKIDDGSELFTTSFNHQQFATGLDALASLDTNHDGLIDAGDVDFSNLVVWKDANGDGISQPSELTTLADNGISSIGLAATPTDTSVDGQEVTAEGTVTHVDGSTSGYAEVSLDTSLGSPTPLLGVTDSSSFNDGFDWDNIVVPPADGSNTLQGTDGADKFTLTDLHAVELIADYNFDQGDSIDLSVLLGHNSGVTQQNVADHVHYDSTTGALSVAETGAGGAPEFIDVAVLNHPVPDVKVVLDDGVDVTINHLG